MRLGIFRKINKLYISLITLKFSVRKFVFGFENANSKLSSLDKRSVIPILKNYGATIGENCDIESHLIIHNCHNYKYLTIGNNCHLGKDVFLDLKSPIVLEDSVTISMRTTILTHIDVGKSELKNHPYPDTCKKVVFEEGCYIGAGATILHGITIGKCAVVGAGALVAKDVPSFSVVGGVPAKVIKKVK